MACAVLATSAAFATPAMTGTTSHHFGATGPRDPVAQNGSRQANNSQRTSTSATPMAA